MKMDLNIILMSAEELFFKYCRKSVIDCFQVVDMETITWYQQTSLIIIYEKRYGHLSLPMADLSFKRVYILFSMPIKMKAGF